MFCVETGGGCSNIVVLVLTEIKVGCGRKQIGWRLSAVFARLTAGSAAMKCSTALDARRSLVSLLER